MTLDTTKTYTATVKTTAGTFDVALDAKTAPQTVNNFVFLAQKGFYHCVIFHRVIPNFMDQTGDPTGTGDGGPGLHHSGREPAEGQQREPSVPVGLGRDGQHRSAATRAGASSSSWPGPKARACPTPTRCSDQVTSGMNVVDTINQQGSAQGVPPDVTHASSRHHPRDPKDTQPWPPPPRPPPTARARSSGSSTKSRRCSSTRQALRGDDDHVPRHDGHRSRPAGRAQDRQQLRLPGPLPLLRRDHLPPHHPRVRAPGGDPTARGRAARATGSPTSSLPPAATRSGRWPWPTPARTPTGASSS